MPRPQRGRPPLDHGDRLVERARLRVIPAVPAARSGPRNRPAPAPPWPTRSAASGGRPWSDHRRPPGRTIGLNERPARDHAAADHRARAAQLRRLPRRPAARADAGAHRPSPRVRLRGRFDRRGMGAGDRGADLDRSRSPTSVARSSCCGPTRSGCRCSSTPSNTCPASAAAPWRPRLGPGRAPAAGRRRAARGGSGGTRAALPADRVDRASGRSTSPARRNAATASRSPRRATPACRSGSTAACSAATASRSAAPSSMSGRTETTGSTRFSVPRRPKITSAAASRHGLTAASASSRCARCRTRSRMTARSVRCCRRRGGTRGARRTSTSSSAPPDGRTLTTHIFDADSEYLDSDVVFAVKPSLVRRFTTDQPTPDGAPALSVRCDLVLAPAA